MFVRVQGHLPLPKGLLPPVFTRAKHSLLHEVGLRKWLWCTGLRGKLHNNHKGRGGWRGLEILANAA